MINRKPRSCRRPAFQIESLENRGLLSTLVAHCQAIPAEVQTLTQTMPLTATVKGTAVLPPTISPGVQFSVSITASGQSPEIGPFTIMGTQTDTLDSNGNLTDETGDATLTVVDENGVPTGDTFHLEYELVHATPNRFGFNEIFNIGITGKSGRWTGTLHATDVAISYPNVSFVGNFVAFPGS
jgi:hypothetical protein